MSFDLRFRLEGLEDVQRATRALGRAIAPEGRADIAVRAAALEVIRYAGSITHVLTGALRASHMAELQRPALIMVTPDPRDINPLGDRPAQYGPVEHARGGSHAFYQRTVDEDLMQIGRAAAEAIAREIGGRVE